MLDGNEPLGRFLRWPLQAIPKTAIVPVLSGPNRGRRWIVGAGQHGCWIGNYERFCVQQITSRIKAGMTVFDVGAHAGYYCLAMSSRVGRSGRVFAFEPNATNAKNLRRHLQINGVSNVEVIEAAVCDRSGSAKFCDQGYNGQLFELGRPVQTVVLDDFPNPDFIKMDIEGAEGLAMLGATRILSSRHTVWFVALHAQSARLRCLNALDQSGYDIEWIAPNEILATCKP